MLCYTCAIVILSQYNLESIIIFWASSASVSTNYLSIAIRYYCGSNKLYLDSIIRYITCSMNMRTPGDRTYGNTLGCWQENNRIDHNRSKVKQYLARIAVLLLLLYDY